MLCPSVVWAGEFKTGLGFEIGPRQQECQRSPNIHLMDNPAVVSGGAPVVQAVTRYWHSKDINERQVVTDYI